MKNTICILKGVDKTDEVHKFRQLSAGLYAVKFYNNEKEFNYRADSVIIEPIQEVVDTSRNILQVGSRVASGVKSIYRSANYYRVVYNSGYKEVVPATNATLVGSCLSGDRAKNIFDYYRTIAKEVGIRTDSGRNLLSSYFDKVDFIREDTILADFLAGNVRREMNTTKVDPDELLFPFGFNVSQRQATINALDSKISIIEGPPGTGKTQTILSIVSNLMSRNKTVAVVSNNNSAIDNIYEKLKKENLHTIVARLGSLSNKQQFIEDQRHSLSNKQQEAWCLSDADEQVLRQELADKGRSIQRILVWKRQKAELETEQRELQSEYNHFLKLGELEKNVSIEPNLRKSLASSRVLDLWQKFDRGNVVISRWSKLVYRLRYGIKDDGFYEQPYEAIVLFLRSRYYVQRSREINRGVEILSRKIGIGQLEKNETIHKDLSLRLLRSNVAKRQDKRLYAMEDLWKNSGDFMKDYPLVLSTTHSLRGSLNFNHVYDYVIVDESSQVDLATFVLALSCARRVVVVGDQKQLPNVITGDVRKKDNFIAAHYSIPTEYTFSQHSALSVISSLFSDQVPNQLLREHYRCHPRIIDFCNKTFYNDELIILTDVKQDAPAPLKIYRTQPGNHARDDHVNQRQIDVLFREVIPKEKLNIYDGSVGVVSPYRNHTATINQMLNAVSRNKHATLAATVDKFQGRERDTVVLNTVDNKISDFASNPNRLNVAVSRAKDQLIVITGHKSSEPQNSNTIHDLIDYIEYQNYETVESNVRSIFDYLYKGFYKRRRLKNISVYDSENLMYELIEDVLQSEEFSQLACIPQYPLRGICDTTLLTGRKRQYAENENTRVDFILFKKVSKKPILAVEVDGWTYHASKTKNAEIQRERDRLKSEILAGIGVPLIRFSTTGSNEKELLVSSLRRATTQHYLN